MKAFFTLVPGSFGPFSHNTYCLSGTIEVENVVMEDIPEMVFDITNRPEKQSLWPNCRSLSVTDIVIVSVEDAIKGVVTSKAWICERIGWREANTEELSRRLVFNGHDSERFMAFRK